MCTADRPWLRQRFLRLATQVGLDPHEFARLDRGYSESHRHYHNWRHVEECLRRLDRVAGQLDDVTSVEIAIWYHDAVWIPGSHSNELESAEAAYRALLPVDPRRAEKVRDLIRETDYSRPGRLRERDLDYLKDIDFASFGKPFAEFWDDVQRLQRERTHATAQLHGEGGQTRFYAAILAGKVVLFRTAWFASRFQDQAMANVRRALDALLSGRNATG